MADVRDFTLPDLGEGLEEAEILTWLVAVGDHLALNQPVCEVETAKAVVEVPSPFAGRVVERIGSPGEVLEVGSVLLRIDVASDQAVDGADDSQGPGSGAEGDVVRDGDEDRDRDRDEDGDGDREPQPLVGYGRRGSRSRRRRGATTGAGGRARAKPPVRRLARQLGVDLTDLSPGSGPDGTITREDVRAAAEAGTGTDERPGGAPAGGGGPGFRGRAPGEVEEIRGIRRRIVEKMEASRREIPEATASRDVDVTRLWELRGDLTARAAAEGSEVPVTPGVLVMRAVVSALRRFPTLNARLDREEGRIRLLESVHLGFAVDTERGLVVPNIKDADGRSVLGLAREADALTRQAREGSIRPADLTGGTFTVNNHGVLGTDVADPIINHPEAGLLAVGAMRERPWVVDGRVAVRRVCTLTVAFDHRVCDGGEAGRFVTHVADLCEDPARILLHG